MSRFSATSRLAKHLDVDTTTARQIIDEMGTAAMQKGDEYVYEILQQPERAARAQARGYRDLGMYGGGGALAGGTLAGGGFAYKGHADREAAARAAETEEEKLAIVADVLNDPSVSSADKADILDALNDAGIFRGAPDEETLWERIFGSGEKKRPGNSLAASLNPIQALGGGIGGTLLTLALIWAAVHVWRDR